MAKRRTDQEWQTLFEKSVKDLVVLAMIGTP